MGRSADASSTCGRHQSVRASAALLAEAAAAGLLLAAAAAKLLRFESWSVAASGLIRAVSGIRSEAAPVIAASVPTVELALAAAICAASGGRLRRDVLWAVLLLGTIFVSVRVALLVRGVSVDCGCIGAADLAGERSWVGLAASGLLVVLTGGAVALRRDEAGQEVPRRPRFG